MPSGQNDVPGSATIRGRHLPGLDGLRAIAVLGVVAYHVDVPFARGGFLGVDLFFVLSGFLITSLLVEEHQATSRVALSSFWGRRARRLLPGLFAMLISVTVYVSIVRANGVSISLSTLRGDALSAIFYFANWHLIAAQQSYFALFAAPSPLQHTWSLAIEEQFYLLFPIAAVLFLRRFTDRRRRGACMTMLFLAGASAIEMGLVFHPGSDPTRIYYGTDTRAFDLLIGSGLAFATAGRGPLSDKFGRILDVAAWPAGLILALVWAIAGTTSETPKQFMYRGGFLACALLAAVIIAAAALRPKSRIAVALSFKPLAAIGIVSYGVYLWHWPIIVLINQTAVPVGRWTLVAVQCALIAAFTAASYFLLER